MPAIIEIGPFDHVSLYQWPWRLKYFTLKLEISLPELYYSTTDNIANTVEALSTHWVLLQHKWSQPIK